MRNICCARNCDSRRKNVKFHRFPRNEEKQQKWLQKLNCNRLKELTHQNLLKNFVCDKHFEKKFVTSRNRLHFCAYPTLFTDEEIDSGIATIDDPENDDTQEKCDKKKHVDHSYSKPLTRALIEQNLTSNNSSNTHHESQLNRHCYGIPIFEKLTKEHSTELDMPTIEPVDPLQQTSCPLLQTPNQAYNVEWGTDFITVSAVNSKNNKSSDKTYAPMEIAQCSTVSSGEEVRLNNMSAVFLPPMNNDDLDKYNIECSTMPPENGLEYSTVPPEDGLEYSTVSLEDGSEYSTVSLEDRLECSTVSLEDGLECSTMPPEDELEYSTVQPENGLEYSTVSLEDGSECSTMPPEDELECSTVPPEEGLDCSTMPSGDELDQSNISVDHDGDLDSIPAPNKAKRRRLVKSLKSSCPNCQTYFTEYCCARKKLQRMERAKQASKLTKEQSFEKLTKKINPIAKKFFWMQIKQSFKKNKGRRYTDEEKVIALALFKSNPQGYTFLENIFAMPTTHTLNKMIRNMNLEAERNPQMSDMVESDESDE